MIDSCSGCKSNCCKVGPGPYKKVTPEIFLQNFGEFESYNTRCDGLSEENTCTYWNTKKMPQECKEYVCSSRSFSTAELNEIANLTGRKM